MKFYWVSSQLMDNGITNFLTYSFSGLGRRASDGGANIHLFNRQMYGNSLPGSPGSQETLATVIITIILDCFSGFIIILGRGVDSSPVSGLFLGWKCELSTWFLQRTCKNANWLIVFLVYILFMYCSIIIKVKIYYL